MPPSNLSSRVISSSDDDNVWHVDDMRGRLTWNKGLIILSQTFALEGDRGEIRFNAVCLTQSRCFYVHPYMGIKSCSQSKFTRSQASQHQAPRQVPRIMSLPGHRLFAYRFCSLTGAHVHPKEGPFTGSGYCTGQSLT